MAEENINQEKEQKKIKVWKKKYIHLVSEENDIKFHGPLSYRHLRIAGWLFLFLSQLGVILGIANSVGLIQINSVFVAVLKSLSSLMMPLFLFAAFAKMLTAKDGYRGLILLYVGGAIGIYIAFIIFYAHFALGLISAATGGYESARLIVDTIIESFNNEGTLAFNIFVDLALCTLITFFINYRPTRFFQGKKVIFFRLFVIFPILYEIGSIAVKMMASADIFDISPFVVPLLTTKPPLALFLFIFLALFIKNRERFYIRHGKTHEEYQAFLSTNVNRLHFSLFLVTSIVITVALDIVAFFAICIFKMAILPQEIAEDPRTVSLVAETTLSWGFGKCLAMLLLIPIIIFFDYTKTHKNKLVDMIIPAAGVALLVVLYIEGLFEVARFYLIGLSQKANESTNKEAATYAIKGLVNKIRQR